jgi:hypothetical protein
VVGFDEKLTQCRPITNLAQGGIAGPQPLSVLCHLLDPSRPLA